MAEVAIRLPTAEHIAADVVGQAIKVERIAVRQALINTEDTSSRLYGKEAFGRARRPQINRAATR